MVVMQKPNPFGLRWTDIVLLGGAAWLVLTPSGKRFLDTLFPPLEGGAPVGFGTATGGVPGQPGIIMVPQQTQFRWVGANWSGTVHHGSVFTLNAQVDHIGPRDTYVVGVQFAPHRPVLCELGSRAEPVYSIEGDLVVADDPVFNRYTATVTGVFAPGPEVFGLFSFGGVLSLLIPGSGSGQFDLRVYVRDAFGRLYLEQWYCNAGVIL